MEQKTGTAATLALVAAIGGYVLIFATHPFWGFIVEVVAIISGIIGFITAASPRVSGGIMSIFAIILGVIGLVIAILGMVGVILF